ncbi:MAG: peptide-binding protein [Nitrospirae bacterium YQR-1]
MNKIILSVLLCSLAICGCESGGAEQLSRKTDNVTEVFEPAYGDTIVEGAIGEPSVLIPMLAGDSASHAVAGHIFSGLVKYAPDLQLTGDLAESWDVSTDGLVITFHLRRGVRWTDGVEFTADDVMFGYKTIIDEKTPSAYKEDFLQVKQAEVLDKHTFRVTYEKPFAPALSSWGALVVLPKHLLDGKDILKDTFRRSPVGMGPYVLDKWIAGERVELKSNHDYFEGRPYIDKYVYRIIPDQSTMFLELKTGSIDFMGLTPIQYKRQTDTALFKEKFQKFRYPVFNYTFMGFNLKHPFFQDKRVRQAISHAIDKGEIVDAVLFGLGSPSTGPYVPNTWPYNPNVKKYDFNPAKARSLLREAGWMEKDRDGVLRKDGNRFEFTIITNMGNSLRTKTATIIQYRLKQVGIKVNIRALEWSTFINEFVDKRRFEAIVLGWSIGLDADQYDIWHSSKTKEKEFNFIGYNNKEVDALLEEGRRAFDKEKRKRAYHRLHEILAEDVPYVFLYVPDALPVVSSRFKGIKPTAIGIGYNQPQWFVPADLQKNSLQK